MKKVWIAVLVAALAAMGCTESTNDDGGGGTGGDPGTGGDGGSGDGGTGGDAGTGGTGGDAVPTWETITVERTLGGDVNAGDILQVGFVNTAGNFEGSGVFYDNVVISLVDDVGNATTLVEDDFETSPDGSIIGGGWLYFVNVFDGSGTRKFGYPDTGPGDAPADSGNITGIVDDQGGPEQETQQLNFFNDYSCCDLFNPPATQQGHGPTDDPVVPDSTDRVEVNVFQEPYDGPDFIPAEALGQTVRFTFDAKLGNAEGATTAFAFIKALDPSAGFADDNAVFLQLYPPM